MQASEGRSDRWPTRPRALEAHERGRLEAAAHHAERVYPGPVGELLARELRAHAEFGYRFGGGGLALRVARSLLALPVPPADPANDSPDTAVSSR